MKGVSSAVMLSVIVLIGLNLRPALASISPLLGPLQQITHYSDSTMGLLTTIPVFIMGLGALCIPLLRTWLTTRSGVLLGLGLIGVACLSRFYVTIPSILLVSAGLVGIGIAMIQALLPGFVKARLPQHLGLGMGLMTTGIMAGAALSSYASPYIAQTEQVHVALGIWFIPALIAVLGWWPVSRSVQHIPQNKMRTVVSLSRYWPFCLFFGLSTGAYTLVLAWLPDYYIGFGWSETAAGGLLSIVTLAEVVAGFAVSFFIDRFPRRTPVLLAALLFTLVGLMLLIFSPESVAYLCAILLGLGIGALFPLSLIVTADQGSGAEHTDRLMSLVQGTGYIQAACFPFVAGLLKQHLSSMIYAWMGMAALCLVLMLLTTKLGIRTQYQPTPAM